MRRLSLISLLCAIFVALPMQALPAPAPKGSTTQQAKSGKSKSKGKKGSANQQKGKSSSSKNSSSKKQPSKQKKQQPAKSSNSKKSAAPKKQQQQPQKAESSADVKKQQQATQREIQLTKEQIAANDRQIKNGLADLVKLDTDIKETRRQADGLKKEVSSLDSRIATLNADIAANQAELRKLRESYLKSVKKMRLNKNAKSTLAFVFSAENFNQALRRMRYLQQFSKWKDTKSAEINKKVEELDYQTRLLSQTKADKDRALARQVDTQRKLEGQYARQDALVADLKANGKALNDHLARKQAEAVALNNRISALIAEEQRKAEAEQRAREEAERKRQADELAKRQEQERLQAEARAREEESRKAAEKQQTASKENAKKDTKKDTKKEPAKEQKQTAPEPKKQQAQPAKNQDYAAARNRTGRGDKKAASTSAAPAKTAEKPAASAPAASGFGNLKGSLPRPVSGSFRITSPFGRHPLPELPGVEYDNPGIDAEVAAGSSAQAVYEGKVSGIYKLPGYNTVVIVSHGNYYTVYGNIEAATVKAGDTVKQGHSLGRLAKDDSGRTSIHFEVWHNRDKLNPSAWIR